MNINEIEYPLRLCVEMVNYCVISNPKTQNMKMSEINEALLQFFTAEQLEQTEAILTGITTQTRAS